MDQEALLVEVAQYASMLLGGIFGATYVADICRFYSWSRIQIAHSKTDHKYKP